MIVRRLSACIGQYREVHCANESPVCNIAASPRGTVSQCRVRGKPEPVPSEDVVLTGLNAEDTARTRDFTRASIADSDRSFTGPPRLGIYNIPDQLQSVATLT